jgi:predicted MPP superfamily phosphohydrolase
VRVPGFGPLLASSRHARELDYGHLVRDGRHLIVSGGLGLSGLPLRIAMPPEIVLIELG